VVVLGALVAGLLWVEAGLPDVNALAKRTPRRTALMRERQAEARKQGKPYRVDQRWVPYSRISPLLRRAVLIAEDDAFYTHGGLDWNEIRASARKNVEAGRVVRGGSTITQQLARNLYLSAARTPTRKLEEVLLALRLERALTKRRIFEIYLNVIEWGDGIYGVEAAAVHYFGVSAADLDARQAALLAAVIINPRRYSVLDPSPRIENRVRTIASRLRRRGFLSEEQYRVAIGERPAAPAWWEFWRRPEVAADSTMETAPPGVHGAPESSEAGAESLATPSPPI
jgi:monofunctional biosynthetic peptidoglycan transglycosylase